MSNVWRRGVAGLCAAWMSVMVVCAEESTGQPISVPESAVDDTVTNNTEDSGATAAETNKYAVGNPVPTNDAASTARTLYDGKTLLLAAMELESRGAFGDARSNYYAALLCATNGLRSEIEGKVGRLNMQLLTTPLAMPEKIEYTVKLGDSLGRIARTFGSTEDLLITNNLIKNPSLIKAGDRMRILNGKFAITVSKSRNDLVVTLNNRFCKRYSISTGKYGKTPAGTYIVSERIKEPVWWRQDGKMIPYGDKENILGTRWMTLKAVGTTEDIRGYGIHGTWDIASVGQSSSLGCIRMRNEDVEELFVLLPIGTPVTIEE